MQTKVSEIIEKISQKANCSIADAERTYLEYFRSIKEQMLVIDKFEMYTPIGSFKISRMSVRNYLNMAILNLDRFADTAEGRDLTKIELKNEEVAKAKMIKYTQILKDGEQYLSSKKRKCRKENPQKDTSRSLKLKVRLPKSKI